ncbi:DUF4383 domain-containing protein [Streptomyces sp. SID3212]|uniref:DUF4383 domain-containing protein n=1 Tax=unclassified Streptomyces TaxID=2593676 RepID=UPI00136D6A46|nr:DUF4383 domain-containing protein [Streptomyces sp. SID3212]MYV52192.1 DUF4383 domain-containing protein [Streptomyces sp. SID3212]
MTLSSLRSLHPHAPPRSRQPASGPPEPQQPSSGPPGSRRPRTLPLRSRPRRRVRIDEALPLDHKLNQVYRIGAGLIGLALLVFGILGLIDRIGFFTTGSDTVAGLNTNGTLSVISICVGVILFAGMVIGGNAASTLNAFFGVVFIGSGFVNLALLDSGHNFLAFRMQNVLFSFVVGILLMFFGMYGRVSGGLPHDNPYWRARHPEQAEREQRRRARGGRNRVGVG